MMKQKKHYNEVYTLLLSESRLAVNFERKFYLNDKLANI